MDRVSENLLPRIVNATQKTNSNQNQRSNQSKLNKPKVETQNKKLNLLNRPNTLSPQRNLKTEVLIKGKKPGKSDWDDSAKLEALRNKSPQKQRQKVHIVAKMMILYPLKLAVTQEIKRLLYNSTL